MWQFLQDNYGVTSGNPQLFFVWSRNKDLKCSLSYMRIFFAIFTKEILRYERKSAHIFSWSRQKDPMRRFSLREDLLTISTRQLWGNGVEIRRYFFPDRGKRIRSVAYATWGSFWWWAGKKEQGFKKRKCNVVPSVGLWLDGNYIALSSWSQKIPSLNN